MAKIGSKTHQLLVEVLEAQVKYEEGHPVFLPYKNMSGRVIERTFEETEANTQLNAQRLVWAQERLSVYQTSGSLR